MSSSKHGNFNKLIAVLQNIIMNPLYFLTENQDNWKRIFGFFKTDTFMTLFQTNNLIFIFSIFF